MVSGEDKKTRGLGNHWVLHTEVAVRLFTPGTIDSNIRITLCTKEQNNSFHAMSVRIISRAT